MADVFIPPSTLKREKNRFYARTVELLAAKRTEYARDSLAFAKIKAGWPHGACPRDRPAIPTPPRARLCFEHARLPRGMPFATPRLLRERAPLPLCGGFSWLPLMPLVADEDEYSRLVMETAGDELASGKTVVLGFGALHHVELGRKLLELLPQAQERLLFFIDIHLYAANSLALAALDSLISGIAFAYRYIEDATGFARESEPGSLPLASVGEGFEPPLFMSSACLLKHHAAHGRCPEACGRSWATRMSDRERRYHALVEDCVSMLFRG